MVDIKNNDMLNSNKIFSSFSVPDLSEARTFYGDLLGLQIEESSMGMLELHISDNNSLIIYPKPDHEPASFTVLNFRVDNIDKVVDELIAKGVTFEQYGGEIKTDEKGIFRGGDGEPNIAWFKDPAGNILSVLEE